MRLVFYCSLCYNIEISEIREVLFEGAFNRHSTKSQMTCSIFGSNERHLRLMEEKKELDVVIHARTEIVQVWEKKLPVEAVRLFRL